MTESEGDIIVGVLGQWASGKSTAAKTLLDHLGGEGEVELLKDAVFFANQAVNYVRKLDESKVTISIEEDGSRRLRGKSASVWLGPGEDWETLDVTAALRFDVDENVLPAWLERARFELGQRICETSARSKPIVVEAGFGENPVGHTISDFFVTLEDAGVKPGQVRWIIVEAGFEKRAQRNKERGFGPPVDLFEMCAADGGDLSQEDQMLLRERGAVISRVRNDHDDIERLRADIIAAFEDSV